MVKLDHLVLTVKSVEKTISFYTKVLGMHKEEFGDGRVSLKFGDQKINLHEFGNEFEPKAINPTPGSADLCFLTQTPIDNAIELLKKLKVKIICGPIERTGANGPILSIYFRDPDNNLIELSNTLINR
jgi:catechol 2,3-dioxygenase-like lactoylglutathione lyase family enzyme